MTQYAYPNSDLDDGDATTGWTKPSGGQGSIHDEIDDTQPLDSGSDGTYVKSIDDGSMEDGVCSKGYPKAFIEATAHGDSGYPEYRRRAPSPR